MSEKSALGAMLRPFKDYQARHFGFMRRATAAS